MPQLIAMGPGQYPLGRRSLEFMRSSPKRHSVRAACLRPSINLARPSDWRRVNGGVETVVSFGRLASPWPVQQHSGSSLARDTEPTRHRRLQARSLPRHRGLIRRSRCPATS